MQWHKLFRVTEVSIDFGKNEKQKWNMKNKQFCEQSMLLYNDTIDIPGTLRALHLSMFSTLKYMYMVFKAKSFEIAPYLF